MIRIYFLFFLFWINSGFCLDIQLLKQKLKTSPPKWMLEQIAEDLNPFVAKKNFSEKMINVAWQNANQKELMIDFIAIQSGEITVLTPHSLHGHTRGVIKALKILQQATTLPDLRFIFCHGDYYNTSNPLSEEVDVPIFIFCKLKTDKKTVLIPHFLNSSEKINKEIKDASYLYPWKKKQEKSFWRGGAICNFSKEEALKHPRITLVMLSKTHPQLIDAKITSPHNPFLQNFLEDHRLIGKWISPKEHLSYKYLIDVDGVSNGWKRCHWILLSNSLMIKHDSPFMQWYYRALLPFQHYIPVERNFSDLLEKINWAKKHDQKAKQISEAATDFAEQNLSDEMKLVYFYHLLKTYKQKLL